MPELPTIETERLILRPFTFDDAAEVRELAGAFEVADTTLHIPHPYSDGMAEEWIATHVPNYKDGTQLNLAITDREDGRLLGTIGLQLHPDHGRAEMGYWVGVPYWNQGYCTEAAHAMLSYAFDELEVVKVYASHFARNTASARVMEKLGMSYEGCLRQHVKKWDGYEDLVIRSLLRSEFQAAHPEES